MINKKICFLLLLGFLWVTPLWAAPIFPQGYLHPDAPLLEPGKIQVTLVATSLKGQKQGLYLPDALPGKLAVGPDGSVYLAGGMIGGSPLTRIMPQGKSEVLVKPKVISTAEGDDGKQVPYYESVGPIVATPDHRLIFLYRGITLLDLRHPEKVIFQPVLKPDGKPFRGDEKGYPDMYESVIGSDGYFYVGNSAQWVRVDAVGVGRLLPPSALPSIPLNAQIGLGINELPDVIHTKNFTFYAYPGPDHMFYGEVVLVSPAPQGWTYLESARATKNGQADMAAIFRARLTQRDGHPVIAQADVLYVAPKGWHIESIVSAPNGDIYTGIARDDGVWNWKLLKLSPLHSRAAACPQSATPTERALCTTPTLKKLDTEMADAYHHAFTATAPNSPARKALIEAQRQWLKTRDACGADAVCIEKAYRARIQALKAS
ncbi:MAG: lysozyme inhibitor LprI family protein [Acidithiobacillus sp.]